MRSRVLEMNLEGPYLPGKDRPRFANGRAYSTPRNRAVERRIADEWRLRVGTRFSGFAGPVRVRIDWQNPCPKSVPEGLPDTTKPDADNVAKLVLDALSGVAWKDDAQVVCLVAERHPRFRRRYVYLRVEVEYEEGEGE